NHRVPHHFPPRRSSDLSVTVQDDTSIATYGPRAMQIEEGDASLIDTPEEAERLANVALADLKDMTATTRIQMPLLPTLDVFSGIDRKSTRLNYSHVQSA